jgi:hypothetical protein
MAQEAHGSPIGVIVAGVVIVVILVVGGIVYLQSKTVQPTPTLPPQTVTVTGGVKIESCSYAYPCSAMRVDLRDLLTNQTYSAAVVAGQTQSFCTSSAPASNCFEYSIVLPNQRTFHAAVSWTTPSPTYYRGSCDGGNMYLNTENSNIFIFNINC